MGVAAVLFSVVLIGIVLLDGFEAMILPRRIGRAFRPTRVFYRTTWRALSVVANGLKPGKQREQILSLYGPLSLLGLLFTWVACLILGFGLLHWGLDTTLHTADDSPVDFGTRLYLSGVTFFTLGLGDVVPTGTVGRLITVIEAGIGFGFLAVIIGYLPVMYGSFSKRELTISLLDARAGSPPSASQLLLRAGRSGGLGAVHGFLVEWELWSAELLESHLSYPVLAYYRSQHDNQSWLATLTMILDTCAIVLAGVKDVDAYQTQLTFAMARHTVVDLALVFRTVPIAPVPDRLTPEQFQLLWDELRSAGLNLRDGPLIQDKLAELRGLYEPFVAALAVYLRFNLPPLRPGKPTVDNWRSSAWTPRAEEFYRLPMIDADNEPAG